MNVGSVDPTKDRSTIDTSYVACGSTVHAASMSDGAHTTRAIARHSIDVPSLLNRGSSLGVASSRVRYDPSLSLATKF
jgi:hypothetical protein